MNVVLLHSVYMKRPLVASWVYTDMPAVCWCYSTGMRMNRCSLRQPMLSIVRGLQPGGC